MISRQRMMKCFCCENEFQFGPDVYFGHLVPGYDIAVCNVCYLANSRGWEPFYGVKIMLHLQRKGVSLPLQRSITGRLPRDWPAVQAPVLEGVQEEAVRH